MPDGKKLANLAPGALLVIVLLETAVLILALLAWEFEWWIVDDLPQEIGGVLPLIVPWGGALGGVAIALVGLATHWHKWSNRSGEGARWNTWYLIRPVLGAILGSIGALIVVLLIGSIGTTDEGEIDTSARGAAILMLIAFIIGYRQQTFASLISRAVDVVLGPGESTPTAGYSVTPLELRFTTTLNTPKADTLTISNEGSGLLRFPRSAVKITGTNASMFELTRLPGNIGAGAEATLEVTYRPTAAGPHDAAVEIELASGSQVVALHGEVT